MFAEPLPPLPPLPPPPTPPEKGVALEDMVDVEFAELVVGLSFSFVMDEEDDDEDDIDALKKKRA